MQKCEFPRTLDVAIQYFSPVTTMLDWKLILQNEQEVDVED